MYARKGIIRTVPCGASRWTRALLLLFVLSGAVRGSAAPQTGADGMNARKDAGVPAFSHIELSPPGAPDLEIFDDFDGDGRCDILLCDNRRMLLYLQGKDGFDPDPTLIFHAPDDAIFIDVGDVDGDGGREPLFLSRSGIDVLKNVVESKGEDLHRETLLRHQIVFLPECVDRLNFLDFLCDLTDDEEEDLIIPHLERFAIFAFQEPGRYEERGSIPFTPHADFFTERLSQTGRLKEIVHIPRFFTGYDGKSRLVILFDGTWVTVFEKGENDAYRVRTRQSLFAMDSRPYEDESRAYFGKNVFYENLGEPGDPYTLVIADNRDGWIDFYKPESVVESFSSRLTLKTEGWILKPVFQDLNSDGLKDLILPSIERIGIFTLLRIFFTSRFDIHYMIFFNRGEALYSLVPDFLRTVSLPLSFTAGPDGVNIGHSLIFSFMGDFNGDGINDFVCKDQEHRMGIFTADRLHGFSEEPARRLPVEPLPHISSATTRVKDLNGDGIDDLFLHQKSLENEKDQYDLYLSSR